MLDPLTIERMGEGPILVALSGGGDSVALLHLLSEHFGAARLRAAIVDHKLRDGSARDAQRAADIATAARVSARIYPLLWPNAGPRGHDAARAQRYFVLCEVARDVGARTIVTGHTRDDQAETVLMRAARGSGMRGLAGMRAFGPAPIWPSGRGLHLARPLLNTRRAELREVLASRGATWIEDPANEHEVYARVRARRTLASLEGFDAMRLAALAERLRPHVDAIDDSAAALISNAAAFNDDEVVLDLATWRDAAAVKQRALEALIIAASGGERGASPSQLDTLIDALDQPNFRGATLAGAWLQPRGARVAITRDPGALAGRADGAAPVPPLQLAPGREAVWDGRVALTTDEPGWSVVFNGRSPELQRGAERRPLAAASPHWLLRERVQHLLGMELTSGNPG